MLIHFGGSLTRAEEESVLVPVREHRQAATAGRVAYREEGKDSAGGCSPSCRLSPLLLKPLSLGSELGFILSLAPGPGQWAWQKVCV